MATEKVTVICILNSIMMLAIRSHYYSFPRATHIITHGRIVLQLTCFSVKDTVHLHQSITLCISSPINNCDICVSLKPDYKRRIYISVSWLVFCIPAYLSVLIKGCWKKKQQYISVIFPKTNKSVETCSCFITSSAPANLSVISILLLRLLSTRRTRTTFFHRLNHMLWEH